MKHFDFSATPVTKLPYFSKKFEINLVSKRDDLFAEAGGGSKARMLQYILADVTPENCDVLVTAGGPCSNFNRACALMCAKIGIPMHLIEYTDEPEEWESLNYFICNLVGIRKTRCEKTNVVETIKRVIDKYKSQGMKVKNVYGGGRSIEGLYAYYDAVQELKEQLNNIDYLFVACGTGTTLTGICAGMQKWFPNAKIHAISTARTYEAELQTLEEDMIFLNNYLKKDYNFLNMSFHEEYLCGGYGKTTSEELYKIRECISNEGMIVDPCYSGKAFYGMVDMIINERDKFKGKKIVFWNTGGIFNLLSMRNKYFL